MLLAACGGGGGISAGGQSPDPVAVDVPIAYVKRPVPTNNQGQPAQSDLRRQRTFSAGGDLYLRDRASASAPERNITGAITGGLGDVRDVSVSHDGTKLLFALRLPLIDGADEADQPTWNIYEYVIATSTLRRVIASDITAEQGHDVAPQYLPDGRIVFSSTRQRQSQAVLLDEGKTQFAAQTEDLNEPAFVLHVMNGDGSNIHQISFNQSHDLDPTVLMDGRVLFARWDHMGGRNGIHLYSVRPDGTELQAIYGVHSHQTGTGGATVQFSQPRELSDGRIAALLGPFTGSWHGGNIVLIDTERYSDQTQPVYSYLGLTGPAQSNATSLDVYSSTAISPGGRFASFYPLWDGTDRLLVSWSPCRLDQGGQIVPCTTSALQSGTAQEAAPLYGLWMYDMRGNTQVPVAAPSEGTMYTDVVVAQSRSRQAVLTDKQAGVELNSDWISEGVGVLHIKSVYDLDGTDTGPITTLRDPAQATADQRAARFLRIVKAVGIPDDDVRDIDNTAFGVSRGQLMREIIGYVPIEPDGSVMVKVPANVPLALEVLDKNGRRTSARHQAWVQVMPGETVTCNGCHAAASTIPHGRSEGRPSLNPGAPVTGLPFPNTDPALFADFGETMAQTRARISCQTDCAAITPSVNVNYQDVWTDAATAGRAPDASFGYLYADLTTAAPATAGCQTTWTSACRITINYVDHIAPLWAAARLDPVDGVTDRTCTSCHSPTDAMGAVRVPAGQLDLRNVDSPDQAAHLISYRELFVADNAQVLDAGTLQDQMVQATDANGNPLFQTDANGNLLLDGNGQPIPIMVPVAAPGPSMSVAGARAGYFLGKFDTGGTHANWLTPAEKRLISEWLDIGAQYYNNPFAAPAN